MKWSKTTNDGWTYYHQKVERRNHLRLAWHDILNTQVKTYSWRAFSSFNRTQPQISFPVSANCMLTPKRFANLQIIEKRSAAKIDCDTKSIGHGALDYQARFTERSSTSGSPTSTSGTGLSIVRLVEGKILQQAGEFSGAPPQNFLIDFPLSLKSLELIPKYKHLSAARQEPCVPRQRTVLTALNQTLKTMVVLKVLSLPRNRPL